MKCASQWPDQMRRDFAVRMSPSTTYFSRTAMEVWRLQQNEPENLFIVMLEKRK